MVKNSELTEHPDRAAEAGFPRPRAMAATIMKIMMWGLLFGFAGFAAGFAGPLLLLPQLPQGPLLGIFITGPAGVIVGCIVGGVRVLKKN